jgi:hypothetical protein
LRGAFSPITGESLLLEMPHGNRAAFQIFLDKPSSQNPSELNTATR